MSFDIFNELLSFVETDYQVESGIILSGQRSVYLAKKAGTADKFVLKACAIQPTSVARIKREIKILSEMDSPFFPKFQFEFFVTQEKLSHFIESFDPKKDQARIEQIKGMQIKPFLITVEEFVENVKWDDCLSLLKQERALVDFLIQLFTGLNLLWEKKIVHRDLKPENILIRPNLQPVIIDLGIAKSLREGATQITHALFPSPCTPRFAAPEQLTNNKTEVTYKSDQFSLGVIAFLVITGRYPYGDTEAIGAEEVVKNILNGRLENARTYTTASEGLIQFIEKLLKQHPYQRFRTIDDIMAALHQIRSNL